MTDQLDRHLAKHIVVDDLIKTVEGWADGWCVGPPRAFFEFPVGEEEHIRGVYKTYITESPTVAESVNALRCMLIMLVHDVARKEQGVFLFWRFDDKIQAYWNDSSRLVVRTRISVIPAIPGAY